MRLHKEIISVCLLFLAITGNAAAKDLSCYMVTGFKNDISSLDEYRSSINLNLDKKKIECKKFSSWFKLLAYYQKQSPIPERIVILQVAHGTPGGGAILDGKEYTEGSTPSMPSISSEFEILGGDIFNYLKSISQKSRVFYINQSCFSGDLIFKKIYHDKNNMNDPSVDRMCMISASGFNLPNYSEGYPDILKTINFGLKSSGLEFLNKTKRSITSATPWNQLIDMNRMLKEYSSTKDDRAFDLEKLNFTASGNSYSCYKMAASLVDFSADRIRNKDLDENQISQLEKLISENNSFCPELADSAQSLLDSIKNHSKIEVSDLSMLLSSRIGTSIQWDNLNSLNNYFGEISRKSLDDQAIIKTDLEKRQYDACKNF